MPKLSFIVPDSPAKARDFRIEVDGKRAGAHRRRVTKELAAAMGHREDVTLRAKHFILALLLALQIEERRRSGGARAPYTFHIRPDLVSGRVRFWDPNQWSDPERSIREEIRRGFPFRDGEPNPVLSYDPLTGVAAWHGEPEFEFHPSIGACYEYVFVTAPVSDPDEEEPTVPQTAMSHAVIVLEGLDRWDEQDLLPIERTVLGGVGGVLGLSALDLKPALIEHGRMTVTMTLPDEQIERLIAAREKLAAWVRPLRLVHVGRLKPESSLLQKLAPMARAVGLSAVMICLYSFLPSRSHEPDISAVNDTGSPGSVAAGSTAERVVRVQENGIAKVQPESEVQLLHAASAGSESATVALKTGQAIFSLEEGPALDVYVPEVTVGVRLLQGEMRVELTRTRCAEDEQIAVPCPRERLVLGLTVTISWGTAIIGAAAKTADGRLAFSEFHDDQGCGEKMASEPTLASCKAMAAASVPARVVVFLKGGRPLNPVRVPYQTSMRDDADRYAWLKETHPATESLLPPSTPAPERAPSIPQKQVPRDGVVVHTAPTTSAKPRAPESVAIVRDWRTLPEVQERKLEIARGVRRCYPQMDWQINLILNVGPQGGVIYVRPTNAVIPGGALQCIEGLAKAKSFPPTNGGNEILPIDVFLPEDKSSGP